MSIAGIVAQGRRLVSTTLLDTARIQDRTLARDTSGGRKETFIERTGTPLRCRFVTPKDNDPALQLDSVFGRVEAIMEVAWNAVDFEQGDRVRNLKNDKIWRIVRDVTPDSTIAVVARLGIAQEVL
jgi:hypothetical protein